MCQLQVVFFSAAVKDKIVTPSIQIALNCTGYKIVLKSFHRYLKITEISGGVGLGSHRQERGTRGI